MIRPTRATARLALAIVAALAALPAVAAAGPPAGDEYVLQIPGVRQTGGSAIADSGGPAGSGGDRVQYGVVGENASAPGPLASLGDALAAVPASLAAGLAALLALLLIGGVRRPVRRGSR